MLDTMQIGFIVFFVVVTAAVSTATCFCCFNHKIGLFGPGCPLGQGAAAL
jgi:hypothetical protein